MNFFPMINATTKLSKTQLDCDKALPQSASIPRQPSGRDKKKAEPKNYLQ